jgi:hypothetical protein
MIKLHFTGNLDKLLAGIVEQIKNDCRSNRYSTIVSRKFNRDLFGRTEESSGFQA